ncbi:hypothetical protein K438DRAFT_1799825 [Mycena galopus ATCC 62051]|nr:hypothetical protein K438DRAFT_1799825 [Mycena galopus ATCC 62051]
MKRIMRSRPSSRSRARISIGQDIRGYSFGVVKGLCVAGQGIGREGATAQRGKGSIEAAAWRPPGPASAGASAPIGCPAITSSASVACATARAAVTSTSASRRATLVATASARAATLSAAPTPPRYEPPNQASCATVSSQSRMSWLPHESSTSLRMTRLKNAVERDTVRCWARTTDAVDVVVDGGGDVVRHEEVFQHVRHALRLDEYEREAD